MAENDVNVVGKVQNQTIWSLIFSIHSRCGICAKCYNMAHLAHQTPKTEFYQMC